MYEISRECEASIRLVLKLPAEAPSFLLPRFVHGFCYAEQFVRASRER